MGYSPWSHKELDTTEQLTHTLQSKTKEKDYELDVYIKLWEMQTNPQGQRADLLLSEG